MGETAEYVNGKAGRRENLGRTTHFTRIHWGASLSRWVSSGSPTGWAVHSILRKKGRGFCDGDVFTLRLSFVMPYMMGDANELDGPLLLLSIGTPCWVVTRLFGRNDMFW